MSGRNGAYGHPLKKSLFKTNDSQQTLGWEVAKHTVKSLYSSIFTRKWSTAVVPSPGPGLSPTMHISDDLIEVLMSKSGPQDPLSCRA